MKVGDLCRLVNEGFTINEDGKNWLFIITKVSKDFFEASVITTAFEDYMLYMGKHLRLNIDKQNEGTDGVRVIFTPAKRTYKQILSCMQDPALGFYYWEGDLQILTKV